jgi:hypothetical protein
VNHTDKPHQWREDRCSLCGMHRAWEGAQYPCEAHNVYRAREVPREPRLSAAHVCKIPACGARRMADTKWCLVHHAFTVSERLVLMGTSPLEARRIEREGARARDKRYAKRKARS